MRCHIFEWLNQIYEKAENNIRKWGVQSVDLIILAMVEELGELAQSYLQFKFEGGSYDRIGDELDDLTALMVQLKIALSMSK